MSILKTIITRKGKSATPQTERSNEREVQNSAGGFVYQISDFDRLKRFLILGSEGGTYYAGERKLTLENAEVVCRCVKQDGLRTIRIIEEISRAGRAPKNDQALFALAIVCAEGDKAIKEVAYATLPLIARTGTHLFQFVQFSDNMRGWGMGLRKAIARWYTSKDPNKLAYQLVKYQSREGWSHRDLLRKCRPALKGLAPAIDGALQWAVKGGDDPVVRMRNFEQPGPIVGFEAVKECFKAKAIENALAIIKADRLTHEMVPSEMLKDPRTWEVLSVPYTALVRNLGRLTSIGYLVPLGKNVQKTVERLTNPVEVAKSRIHPINLLNALNTYKSGHGQKGNLSWTPVPQISAALEAAFYLSFGNVPVIGKNIYVGLDVSGSMAAHISGYNFDCRTAAVVMAMATIRREPNYHVRAFAAAVKVINVFPRIIRPSQFGADYNTCMTTVPLASSTRLAEAIDIVNRIPMGGTDCALPMLDALDQGLNVDTFIIYTDNETWAGDIKPVEALERYRARMNKNAKLVVAAFTSSGFSIAAPNDPGMLDVVGFDSATPSIISGFISDGETESAIIEE